MIQTNLSKSVLLLAVSRFQDELRKVVVVERLADVVCVTGSQVVEMEMECHNKTPARNEDSRWLPPPPSGVGQL